MVAISLFGVELRESTATAGRTPGVLLGVAMDSLKSAMPLLGSCSRSAILASARPVGSMKLNANG
jgi:hypothetical protein